jgi:hypothetical protein
MTERKHKTVRLLGDSLHEHLIDDAIDRAIAAIEGESGLVTQLVSVHHSFRIDGVCFVTVLADVEKPQMKTQKTAEECGFATHPLQVSDEVMLGDLRPGAIFIMQDGSYAVKSLHHDRLTAHNVCVSLATGNYIRLPDGNQTLVREVRMV